MKILGLKIPPAEMHNPQSSSDEHKSRVPTFSRGTTSDSSKAQGAVESQAPGPGENSPTNSQTKVVYHVSLSD